MYSLAVSSIERFQIPIKFCSLPELISKSLENLGPEANQVSQLLGSFFSIATGGTFSQIDSFKHGIDWISLRCESEGHLTRDLQRLVQYARRSSTFTYQFRILESILRHLNNLHERLHHSVFFYMITGPRQFVPISKFIVPYIVLLLGTAIMISLFEFILLILVRIGDRLVRTSKAKLLALGSSFQRSHHHLVEFYGLDITCKCSYGYFLISLEADVFSTFVSRVSCVLVLYPN
jgi:hypothetical protein